MRIHSKDQLALAYNRIKGAGQFMLFPQLYAPSLLSQQQTSNLVINILLTIHQTNWKCNCSSRYWADRNRHSKVPEDLWREDLVAALPGWRPERPNMQPVTPVTSYMISSSESDLMWSLFYPTDLWHIKRTGYLTSSRTLT
jgi:hypothetical protein